ncbi:ribosome assembly factor SBDS [Candidatus Woesearchaeota archaeon]|jgi:ribosome maturation protein SDO1|nr:ribosome assembly factor SBDS [Candidatus Woesearchaeota archaeon]MBT3538130.1 ribosome assembly factor SBDS [Candidatus Woesearchaeota archaeon]MBT4697511.1 ribosome assembly factor SBDS [Candidatus Woesearchaeota archaeon]MBT4717358.1 ribosome assembly factor SBDS [Candidatus Woesearchaeota archaeon]MBT7105799.1 ribosome assembly factor SBDS [Candidatus Woesearchaeota archaeon]
MSRLGTQTYDKERVSFNIARLKKGGDTFEIIIDADKAIAFKEGKDIDMKDILMGEKIMSDANRGLHAPETKVQELFGTDDAVKVAESIIKEGEIQLTSEYRNKVREDKMKQLVALIARNAIDPKTNLPHPPVRIQNAMDEAKIKLNEFKTVEDQLEDVVSKLRPILPIKFEQRKIQIRIPAQFAGKAYNNVTKYGKPTNEAWLNDGSWTGDVELPAGLVSEFLDELNGATKGGVESKIIER